MSFRKNRLILVPAPRAPDALEPIASKSIFGERILLRASSVVFLFFNTQNFNAMKKVITLLLVLAIGMLSFTQNVKGQTMIINELSNGSAGNQEFVEFLVTGSCGQTLDIRGWYYDDNCVIPGATAGCGRFANIAQWAAVPVGSIIVIYNGGDPNISMPAEDPTDANGDGVYIISSIIPSTGNVIEYQTTALTDCNASSYTATTGYVTGISWTPVGLGNTADLFQIRNSSGVQQFSVGYGTGTTGCTIYFVGTGDTRSYIFTGTAGSDPTNSTNWTSVSAGTTQSPGRANNCDNAAFIEALLTVKDNEFKVAGCPNITATNTTLCIGATASKNLTGSVSDNYVWSTSDASVATVSGTGQNATITAVGAGTANIIVTVTHTYSNLYTGLTGCAATPIAKTMTYPVTVNASVTTLYVDASIATSGNGQSWATAYKTLDEALAIAHCCSIIDTIKVAAGTYLPTKKPYNGCTEMTTADARDITFHLPDGLVLWGGYPAGGGVRNSTTNVTTLSGDIGVAGNADNAYHVVLASTGSGGAGVTVDGFSITVGNANDASFSTIIVNGNTIGRYFGGGIYTVNGTNTLSNNTLSGNSADNNGGGILTYHGTNTLSNNTFSGNSAGSYGGGIYTYNGTNTLTNNTLSGNSVLVSGGGIYIFGGTNTLSNNTLSGNSAYFGGGIYTLGGTNTLTNNTLSGNSATYDGGGIYTYNGTNTIINNILWDNKIGTSATVAGADYFANGINGNTFTNNLLQLAASNYTTVGTGNYDLGTAGSGNIFAQNPLFVNAADIDGADNIHRTEDDGLRLQIGSPCINTGIILA